MKKNRNIWLDLKRSLDDILSPLNEIDEKLRELREPILSILVMTGENPAPTFNEEERVEFLINRFKEAELDRTSIDADSIASLLYIPCNKRSYSGIDGTLTRNR